MKTCKHLLVTLSLLSRVTMILATEDDTSTRINSNRRVPQQGILELQKKLGIANLIAEGPSRQNHRGGNHTSNSISNGTHPQAILDTQRNRAVSARHVNGQVNQQPWRENS